MRAAGSSRHRDGARRRRARRCAPAGSGSAPCRERTSAGAHGAKIRAGAESEAASGQKRRSSGPASAAGSMRTTRSDRRAPGSRRAHLRGTPGRTRVAERRDQRRRAPRSRPRPRRTSPRQAWGRLGHLVGPQHGRPRRTAKSATSCSWFGNRGRCSPQSHPRCSPRSTSIAQRTMCGSEQAENEPMSTYKVDSGAPKTPAPAAGLAGPARRRRAKQPAAGHDHEDEHAMAS